MKKGLIRYMEQVVCNPHFRIVGYNKEALIVKAEPDVPSSFFFYEIYEFLRRNTLKYSRVEYDFGGVKSFADITDFAVSDIFERYQKELFKKYPQATNIFFTPSHTLETIKNSYRRKRISRLIDNVCRSIKFEGADGYASWVYGTIPTSLQNSVEYAFRLGKYLQYLITRHNVTLDKIIDNAIYDVAPNDLSKAERNIGIAILIQIWKYGNEFSLAFYA